MATDIDVRHRALTLACQVVAPESPPGHYLSTARQFARYIASGVSVTGAGGRSGVQTLVEGLVVRVDGAADDDTMVRIDSAIREALKSVPS